MKKTALITGASRGIGKAAALLFAQEGYNVVVNYLHSREQADRIVQAINAGGGSAIAVKADVAQSGEVNRMALEAEARFGAIDVLINNAGIGGQRLLTEITDEEWNRMLAVNLTGVFNCCRAVLPGMIRRKSGKIINLSSIWGITGGSYETHYSAAKAGVVGLTKALAKEVGPSNIQVNCVAPGVIDTEMNAGLTARDRAALCDQTPLMRLGTAEEVAHVLLFLASSHADFITGQVISPNGGFVI